MLISDVCVIINTVQEECLENIKLKYEFPECKTKPKYMGSDKN